MKHIRIILFFIMAIAVMSGSVSVWAADGDPVLEPVLITEIESTDVSGSDDTLISGTAGTNTYAAVWNADGDLIDGPGVPAITNLSNIASTAVPVDIISDTALTDSLGSEAIPWLKMWLGSEIAFEGSSDDAHRTTLSVTDPTGTRTITVPDSDQTIGVATSAGADAIDAITEIAAGLKTGSDEDLVTGTAGTNTYAAVWNSDGDLVDGPGVPAITTLSNIASTAIPVSLISDTANTDDLGSEAIYWKKLFLASEISFEGSTDNDHQTTFSITDPTADHTITVPASDQTIGVATSAGAGAIDAITELAAGIKTGSDTKVVTGTAGADGNIATWNSDGDIVDGGAATPGSFGAETAKTIASGVADASGGENYLGLAGEGASADDLTEISAAADGDIVILSNPNAGSYTITVKDGTYLKLQADFALDSVDDTITLVCTDAGENDTFRELSRANNG